MLVAQDMKKTGDRLGAYIAFNIDNEFTRNFIKYLNGKKIVQENKVVEEQLANQQQLELYILDMKMQTMYLQKYIEFWKNICICLNKAFSLKYLMIMN